MMEGGQKRSGRSPRSGKKVSFAGEKALKAQTALEAAKKKEALKETLWKRFEFDQRAVCIVERLLEDDVTDDFLIDCARFITPSNYQDAVEERCIVKMCGYPVCPNKLGSVPKQQFKISTKTNKVYDITERKCFCSNFCYKASKHFEVQISTTPLWLREEERPPDVKLLKKGESGISGEEVKISVQPIRESEIENPEPAESAHPMHLSASGTESEGSDQEQDFVSSVVTGGGAGPKSRTGILKHRGERESNTAAVHTGERDREKDTGTAQDRSAETTGNKNGDKQLERDERTGGNEPQRPAAEADGDGSCTRAVADRPEQAVQAVADLLSACGIEERRMSAVADRPEQPVEAAADLLSACGIEERGTRVVADRPKQPVEAAADLLSACAIEERGTCAVADRPERGSGAERSTGDRAPTPALNVTQVGMSRRGAAELRSLLNARGKDPAAALRAGLLERLSKTLREWRTEETLRLLHGPAYKPRDEEEEEEELDEDDLEVGVEVPASQVQSGGGQGKPSAAVPDYKTLHRETELLSLRVQEFYRGSSVLPEEKNTDPEDPSGWDPALPLVDSHAQLLIQKRIVSEKLNRSLRDIVGPLQLTMNDITDINNLIRTFRFTNANIIHKSPEWTLIAVVLLSVLSDVIPLLQQSLERPSSIQYISTLMGGLMLTDRDLQSLVQLFRVPAN
ncbi:putative RNA polymerase II subunit B1 CTD phosphatase rpap2 [Anguilla rostrata]|uniref:putative RNA polymerase II subunit B1 CTD phosphatase rpap2 n=1 Tax=Anguilla rostrata TaxID=7938 RepID=UPI0030CD5421